MSEASAVLPIANAIIIPKWHENQCDFTLITTVRLVKKKCMCDYKKCAIMKIIALLPIGVNVL